jgi:hypothetical protein
MFVDISCDKSDGEYILFIPQLFNIEKVSLTEKGLFKSEVTAKALLFLSKIKDHAK